MHNICILYALQTRKMHALSKCARIIRYPISRISIDESVKVLNKNLCTKQRPQSWVLRLQVGSKDLFHNSISFQHSRHTHVLPQIRFTFLLSLSSPSEGNGKPIKNISIQHSTAYKNVYRKQSITING